MQQGRVGSKITEVRGRPNSRQRLDQLKKEEQYLSDAFKIDNFYNNEKLDLSTLKIRIGQIKKKAEDLKNNPEEPTKKDTTPLVLIPLSNKIQRLYHPKKPREKVHSGIIAGRQTVITSHRQRNSSALSKRLQANNKNTLNISNELDVKEIQGRYRRELRTPLGSREKIEENNTRYQSIDHQTERKSKELEEQDLYGTFRSTIIPKIQTIGRRQNLTNGKSEKAQSLRKILNSSRLEPLSSYRRKLTFIQVEKQEELLQFDQNIATVWEIYEKLCEIIKTLSFQSSSVLTSKTVSQQFIKVLCQYKQLVCSTRLQFIVEMIDSCLEFSHSKTIILSRLLQNLSVVYVFLEIVDQATKSNDKFYSSHLVNFVGLSSNNLLLIIRLMTLIIVINQSLTICQNSLNIFAAITQFEISSYRTELTSIKQTVMRIEHNNELLSIIQAKLNNKMITRQYHKECFGKFMKGVVIDRLKQEIQVAGDRTGKNSYTQTKPFFEYSYFIFEYLAYHLHHQQYIGLFPKEIETAPQPYLALKKQFTIVMDPSQILIHAGRQKFYVRAHAQNFLLELSQKCNLIFWSDRMPHEIDNLYDIVDIKNMVIKDNVEKNEIKRLYRHHCFYDYNCRGQLALIKDIRRIQCPPGKYIVLGSSLQNFYPTEQNHVILLPWKGDPKDSKLSTVLDFLLPFLRQGTDLSKGLVLLKPRLEQLLKPKKRNPKQQFF